MFIFIATCCLDWLRYGLIVTCYSIHKYIFLLSCILTLTKIYFDCDLLQNFINIYFFIVIHTDINQDVFWLWFVTNLHQNIYFYVIDTDINQDIFWLWLVTNLHQYIFFIVIHTDINQDVFWLFLVTNLHQYIFLMSLIPTLTKIYFDCDL